MSKFIDRLNQVSRIVPQPMGFRLGTSASDKSKILLVASLAEADVDQLVERVAGADAGLVSSAKASLATEVFRKVTRAVPKIPWGGWLKGITAKEMASMAKAGSDFVVFPAATTPINIAQSHEVGKVLEVEASLDESLLRAVNELAVDAAFIDGGQKNSLTWQHLMLFQRSAKLLTKPLLVSIPAEVTTAELQSLWEAGVDGVVVEVGMGQAVDGVKKLREIIDKLTLPPQRKRRKAEALLPQVISRGETGAEEEEEEGEERLD